MEVDDGALQLALDQAWLAIANQLDALKGYHERTATLLGASTIGASFLAALGNRESIDVQRHLALVAVAAFGIQVCWTVYVLYPRTMSFSRSTSWLNRKVLGEGIKERQLRQELLEAALVAFEKNARRMTKLGFAYTSALISFGLAVALSGAAVLVGALR